jgi:hypothetical protein
MRKPHFDEVISIDYLAECIVNGNLSDVVEAIEDCETNWNAIHLYNRIEKRLIAGNRDFDKYIPVLFKLMSSRSTLEYQESLRGN